MQFSPLKVMNLLLKFTFRSRYLDVSNDEAKRILKRKAAAFIRATAFLVRL